MTALALDDVVASPCVRACTLDDAEICLGCGRSLDEIRAWGTADAATRRAVLAAAEKRKAPGTARTFAV